MDQTFDKQKVALAATRAAASVKAERAKRVAAFNALSFWGRVWRELQPSAETRWSAERYDSRRLETAERLIFKASNCEDSIVFLSNDEIDQIKDFWSA
jgi:hypothetical protein